MGIQAKHIAYGVRVKLNSQFVEKCLGDKYLKDEPVLFISDTKPYNDVKGEYVHITGGSLTNSGYTYLNELDLEYPVPKTLLYHIYGEEPKKHLVGGDKVSVNGKLGMFGRYGQSRTGAIVYWNDGGMSFVNEDSIKLI